MSNPKNENEINTLDYKEYTYIGITSLTDYDISFSCHSQYTKIQIIYVDSTKYDCIYKYVDNFDFDITRNYFDGNKIYIENINNIINKTAIYKNIHENGILTMIQMIRIYKYHDKGFSNNLEYLCVYNQKHSWTPDPKDLINVKYRFDKNLTNFPISLKKLNLYNIDIPRNEFKLPFGTELAMYF